MVSSNNGRMDAQGYCMKDKSMVNIVNPQLIRGRNRSIIYGTCERCSEQIFKLLSGTCSDEEQDHAAQDNSTVQNK